MNRGVGCLVLVLVLALTVSAFFNLLSLKEVVTSGSSVPSLTGDLEKPAKLQSVWVDGPKSKVEDRIVQINIQGMITGAENNSPFSAQGFSLSGIKKALHEATKDTSVKAIVLNVNTPGGEVTASDVLYHEVKKAAAVKPVVVYMDAMATSGGYYLSAAANQIVASPTTLTGSIGVIIQTLNYSEAFGKLGLESMTFVSGSFKDSLNGARPMRDEEKAYIQSLVGQMYDRFVTVVAEGRKVSKDGLKSGVADGRILSSQEALTHKLVDKIGYLEDAYATARELAASPEATVVQYRQQTGLMQILGGMGESHSRDIKVEIPALPSMSLQAGQLYLLPAHLVP